mmetsp:Transcript_12899/g.17930  ORF Transcript_12899/g.17930 Transcript_12899/m.17930 type:complete len:101 (+) Transcript_12899:30-332(+)
MVPSEKVPKPCPSNNLREFWPCSWDGEFVEQLDQKDLFELILVANFLDMKPLLALCCAKVACMIKGKNPDQIRGIFQIENDFTEEEEEAVRAENAWAEEP